MRDASVLSDARNATCSTRTRTVSIREDPEAVLESCRISEPGPATRSRVRHSAGPRDHAASRRVITRRDRATWHDLSAVRPCRHGCTSLQHAANCDGDSATDGAFRRGLRSRGQGQWRGGRAGTRCQQNEWLGVRAGWGVVFESRREMPAKSLAPPTGPRSEDTGSAEDG
jgi:hypothetical protein